MGGLGMVNIKLLGLILDEGMHKKANSVLNRLGIKFKTVSNASGTASPSVLDYHLNTQQCLAEYGTKR